MGKISIGVRGNSYRRFWRKENKGEKCGNYSVFIFKVKIKYSYKNWKYSLVVLCMGSM